MESKSASGVIRRKAPLFRYYPYATGSRTEKEKMKKEVVQLGIELSVCVVESMFLLCDDIRSMLLFCYKLWRENSESLLGKKLLRVIHYVYSKDIKPKKRVYNQDGVGKNSFQWEWIRTTWRDFTDGTIVLHRLVDLLGRKDASSFDDRLLSSAIKKYKQQVLKTLEDKLRSAKDGVEVNGFARETIASDVSYFWKSLFDEEATPRGTKTRVFRDLFQPLIDESRRPTSDLRSFSDMIQPILDESTPSTSESRMEINPKHSPYILGRDFAKEELKEEVVQLGVELSVYVAQSMFVLCDDVRSVLLFCLKLWRDATQYQNRDSLVAERLLWVIHYVYLKDIKQKNGVFKSSGNNSVQWGLMRTTWTYFDDGIKYLDRLVSILRGDLEYLIGREFTDSIEEAVKKLEEKLRCVKAVAEANGFARETMESSFLDLWKSVFDKEAKEARETLKVIKNGILSDLFLPLLNQVAAP